jgi:hypothetical protein
MSTGASSKRKPRDPPDRALVRNHTVRRAVDCDLHAIRGNVPASAGKSSFHYACDDVMMKSAMSPTRSASTWAGSFACSHVTKSISS